MEDSTLDKIKWRMNANGLRGPDADYVMRHDKYAVAAFEALRKKGMSKREAKRQIEECFSSAFWFMMFSEEGVRDPRPQCWLLLSEGLSVERIFPTLKELGDYNPSRERRRFEWMERTGRRA
jgi:hypothetical protein